MTVAELNIELQQYSNDTLFDFKYNMVQDFDNVLIIYDYRTAKSSTVEQIKNELKSLNQNMNIEMDIDEGYSYSPIIGIKYLDNKLTFINECYK